MSILRKLRSYKWYLSGRYKIKKQINACKPDDPLNIIIGANDTSDVGWISTDLPHFNILKQKDWEHFFGERKIDRLLAEHVLEHLSVEQVKCALSLSFKYLNPGGHFRIAVPDGNHLDPSYLKYISPPSHGHQSIWNIDRLREVLNEVGYQTQPIEYYTSDGIFKTNYFDFKNGIISRSKALGYKNSDYPDYSSLIIDCFKRVHATTDYQKPISPLSMSKTMIGIAKSGRSISLRLGLIREPENFHYKNAEIEGQAASDLIEQRLRSSEPLMATRFGSAEISAVLVYYYQTLGMSDFEKISGYIRGKIGRFWWDENIMYALEINAGVFPKEIKNYERFGQRILEDMKEIDILGSILNEELIFRKKYFPNAIMVSFPDLEPYYHERPWSAALEGKKVLVIHPFEKTIIEQYKKRELLFENKKMLPSFELKTIKAVQSVAGNNTGFKTWFDALEHMKYQVNKTDFDIALIGCGAYGLPLAAHIKRIGKKSIHVGAGTQILFGIKGKRWENHPAICKLFNEHWVRPDVSEIPLNFTNVEGGCYW